MSKIIQISENSIQRYFPDEKIFKNLINFLDNNFPEYYLLAGGAVRFMFSPSEAPSPADDIDVYLLNFHLAYEDIQKELVKDVFSHVDSKKVNKFKWIQDLAFKGRDNLAYHLSTLVCRPYFPNIQFIGTFYEPKNDIINYHIKLKDEDILNSFDFTVCQASIFKHNNKLICKTSETFMEDETNRVLQLTGKINENLISRVYKYIKLGYTLSEESYIYILNHLATTSDATEKRMGHKLLTKKRNSEDFVVAPYARELYEKWLKSITF